MRVNTPLRPSPTAAALRPLLPGREEKQDGCPTSRRGPIRRVFVAERAAVTGLEVRDARRAPHAGLEVRDTR